MTNDIINGDSNYMAITTLDKNMKEMMIYIPQDMKYVTKVGYNYYYKSSFDDSWLRIYIAPHKGNDVFARQMLNDMANYNKIFGSVNIPVKWNNNAFVTFDARNANGDYLDVACSVNKTYMVYIEYKHKISGDNTFAQMISTIKY
jgi:hypothetical protein